MSRVAVIIPAHNEEKTVGQVVLQAKASMLVSEVIVVSDGSRDQTVVEARQAGADKVVELPHRGGKGNAMACGVRKTNAPILFFLDADLVGFSEEHLEKILLPVLEGKLFMNVGIHDRHGIATWLAMHLPLIGGERAMRREVFENCPEKYRQHFKVETAMNFYCRANHLAHGKLVLHDMNFVRKIEKFGLLVGLWEYIKMSWEIGLAMLEVRMAKGEFVK